MSDDDDTLYPCPRCEACSECNGTGQVRDDSAPPMIGVTECFACEQCAVCGGTQLVTGEMRDRFLAKGTP